MVRFEGSTLRGLITSYLNAILSLRIVVLNGKGEMPGINLHEQQVLALVNITAVNPQSPTASCEAVHLGFRLLLRICQRLSLRHNLCVHLDTVGSTFEEWTRVWKGEGGGCT